MKWWRLVQTNSDDSNYNNEENTTYRSIYLGHVDFTFLFHCIFASPFFLFHRLVYLYCEICTQCCPKQTIRILNRIETAYSLSLFFPPNLVLLPTFFSPVVLCRCCMQRICLGFYFFHFCLNTKPIAVKCSEHNIRTSEDFLLAEATATAENGIVGQPWQSEFASRASSIIHIWSWLIIVFSFFCRK